MKTEIITIHADLLREQTLNTNVAFLTRELLSLGIPVQQCVMLHNHSKDLKQVLQSAEERAGLIILVGDLGSDMRYFYQENETTYILLPESFDELKSIFMEKARPLIIEKLLNKQKIVTQSYSLYGLTLTEINEKLGDLITFDGNPFVGVYDEHDEAQIQLTARADTEKEAKKMVDDVAEKIKARLDDSIYSEKDTRLAAVVKNLLKEQNKKITAAESLTSGSFLSVISEESGASDIFEGGIVTYSNAIKNNVLKVTDETIEKHGVVSAQCAIEMAENSLDMFNADISLSLTGVAGPESLEGERPGTVWIGLAQKGEETFAKQFHFMYQRERNRHHAVLSALNLARLVLLDKPIENQVFLNKN